MSEPDVATDPRTGARVWPCSSGHRHTVKARAIECEARPSAEKSAKALGIGVHASSSGPVSAQPLTRAVAIVQKALDLKPIGGARIHHEFWARSLVAWLAGDGGPDQSDWNYEAGAAMALGVIAGLSLSDPRVAHAEIRALAIEAVIHAENGEALQRIALALLGWESALKA